MDDHIALLIPPAPRVHRHPLPAWRLVAAMLRNPLTVYCEQDFQNAIGQRRLFGRNNIGLNEPAAIRHVLGASAAKYRRPVVIGRLLRWVLGDGLFLAEGGTWRRQRKMLAPVFSPAHTGELLPHFVAAGATLLRRLDGRSEARLSAEFNQATLDALLRSLFSTPADEQGAEMAALVRCYLDGPGKPKLSDALARREGDFDLLNGPRRRFQARWLAMVDGLVAERRDDGNSRRSRDLLDILLAARDPESNAKLPATEVRDQTATMLFAGFETTTRLLSWAVYLLALDQREQALIRREIAAFPTDRVASLGDLENWPRLRRSLLETLRLYPPVPLMVREAIEPDEIMGELIAPGDFVWISPWTLHRHLGYWKHPTAFDPDRFANQSQPWAQGPFMPFGGGPRICIGASFAIAEAQILMAMLLERFSLALCDRRPVLPVGSTTTVQDHEPRFILSAGAARA
jgi:cytochrome P450